MSDRARLPVELTAAELELLTWRLCQPDYSAIGARWDRHRTGKTADEAGSDLYQRLSQEWQDWCTDLYWPERAKV